MKKYPVLITYIVFFFCIIAAALWIFFPPKKETTNTKQTNIRPVERLALSLDKNERKQVSIEGTKIPEFTYTLSDKKFDEIINAAKEKVSDYVQATISYTAYAGQPVDSTVSINKEKRELLIHPRDLPNFTPGKYKLSLKLRTLEGDVSIDQDFTWGVIAFNTNKSIYTSGEIAKIGIGVINDKGETLCLSGINHVDGLTMTITDPGGKETAFSIQDKSIADSGECAPISVTNNADFQANFTTTIPGIYQVAVQALVHGDTREIKDYFKVDDTAPFDIERTSFPTRIYPKAPYGVTLTVIPNQNYSGKVVDIVPVNFVVLDISDGGKEVIDGNFKKIVWDTSLQTNTEKKFSYFIKFPMISPEFYLLGPFTIGGFSESRQWQIASDALNTTSGVVASEDNASQNTWSRVWSGTAFGGETAMASGANTPTDSRWFKEVSSPKTGEKLIAVLDNDTADTVYVYRWNGTAWQTADLRIVMTGNTTAETTRKIDIAYEELSGDAIFVYANSAAAGGAPNQILYRKRVSGVWDGASSIAGTATSPKQWTKLRPQRDSDDILLGTLNTSNFVGAMIWNGSTNTWGSEIVDNGGGGGTATSTNTQEPMDVAWETNSGAAMILYGTTGNNVVYRRFSSGVWGAETTAASGFTNDVAWLVAASNLVASSNQIAVITVELTTQTCRYLMWDGSSWTQASTVSCRANIVEREIGVVWEFDNNRAMFLYVTSALPKQLSYRTYIGSSFGADTAVATVAPGATGTIISLQAYSDSLSLGTVVLCAVNDAGTNAFLYSREWDGSTWSSAFTRIDTHASGIQGSTEAAEAYGFGFDRNLETQVAYRFFTNSNTADGGASSITPLTTQDSAYTLTTANQAFRLRMLLYYPDSLLSTTLRFYKLQYVDPGSGTCASPTGGTPATYTDVPTSGGSTISFNNNSLLNSGDNIATNSADPSYRTSLRQYQDYQESNNFTNSRTNMLGDQVAIWDFSLIDNTSYDRIAQTYCFRVARSNDLVLQLDIYPQLSTAALPDVQVLGGSRIQGGSTLQ